MTASAAYLSDCCRAPMAVTGKGMTRWYVCSACHRPCDQARDDDRPRKPQKRKRILLDDALQV